MKKFIIVLLVLLVLIGAPGFFAYTVISDPLKVDEEIKIQIAEGDSFYNVLGNLDAEGKVKFLPVIKAYLKVTRPNLDMLPGIYSINGNMSLGKILSALTDESGTAEVTITIPEGFIIEQIAEELETNDICTAEQFIEAVKAYPTPSYINLDVEPNLNWHTGQPCEIQDIRYPLEGYLYPDTYKIRKGTDPESIIEMMLAKFEEMLAEAEKQSDYKLNKNNGELSRTIIKASLIEREAKLDSERPHIASVINNRLADGSENPALQIDASCLYAKGEHKSVVTPEDTELDSAYNTYQAMGLPPGPISNPGIESILAAISPKSTNDLFYVLDPNDMETHYFTDNYNDFLAKQREWGYID